MNCFIITSHGWSASNWLAYSLNKHKDITVSHSAANLVDEKLSNNISGKLKKFHTGYVNRQNQTIDVTYQNIFNYEKTKVYGSVHLYRLRDLPVLYKKFGESKYSFNVVNLIRNPVDLVWSGYGQFKELFKTDINELHWTVGKILDDKEFIYSLSDKYNIEIGKYEYLAFIGAARVLGSLKLDIEAMLELSKIPFINYLGEVKMEELTSERKAFVNLIKKITDDSIDITEEYLDEVYNIGKINKHKNDNIKLSSQERFESFTDWQKEVFLFYMNKYEVIDAYEVFGYNLSYLRF